MAKSVHNDVLDAALNHLKNNAAQLSVCSTQPATYAEATSTYKLAITAIDSDDFNGPADGDTSGRKIQVNDQNGVTVDSSGNAEHVAIVSSSDLLYVTTCTSQALTEGNQVSVPAWDIELADPS